MLLDSSFQIPSYTCVIRFILALCYINEPRHCLVYPELSEGCRGRDSNPHDPNGSQDFKSCASTIPPPRPKSISFLNVLFLSSRKGFVASLLLALDYARKSPVRLPFPAYNAMPARSHSVSGKRSIAGRRHTGLQRIFYYIIDIFS